MAPRAISVVVPTNRVSPFLPEALASVAAQTLAPTEILVVDDGAAAPDELAAVAERFGARVVRHPPSGVSAARDAGVADATGDWIAFLDDDDLWQPTFLAKMSAALDAHPTALGAYAGGWHIDPDGAPVGDRWHARPATRRELLSGAADLPYITAILLRRAAFLDVGGFDRNLAVSEDNDLLLRLAIAGELVGVDETLVAYRRHPQNTSARGLAGRRASVRVIRRQRRRLRADGDPETARLLSQNLSRYVRVAAQENLGDAIRAVRARERGYATAVIAWGLRHPAATAGAIRARVGARSASS